MRTKSYFGSVVHVLSVALCAAELFFPDSGKSQNGWTEISLPFTNPNVSIISFVDSSHGCLCGNDGIFFYTSDNGQSWIADTIPSPYPIAKCTLVSDSVVWAFGIWNANLRQWAFLRSSDRGKTWLQKNPPDSLIVMGADFTSEENAWLVTKTSLWATTDGGESWHQRGQLRGSQQFYNAYYHSIEFFDDSVGFIGGSIGLVQTDIGPQSTTNGGWTWNWSWVGPNPGGSAGISECRPVSFVDDSICTFRYGWIDEISIQHFGGLVLSWNRLRERVVVGPTMDTHNPLTKGFALSRQSIWLLRESEGRIRRTTDGGGTWIVDTLAVPISEILFDLDGHRFALGSGRLFRLNAPPDDIETPLLLPLAYELGQCYPNPFNSSTTINYQLPRQGYVTLTVFDMLGQEVGQLVDGIGNPGYMSVQFDASHLSSGVYFYRLQSGDFVQVKKLILLR
jgi:photosystem II stability/assembly factor-like uncharacterized protein